MAYSIHNTTNHNLAFRSWNGASSIWVGIPAGATMKVENSTSVGTIMVQCSGSPTINYDVDGGATERKSMSNTSGTGKVIYTDYHDGDTVDFSNLSGNTQKLDGFSGLYYTALGSGLNTIYGFSGGTVSNLYQATTPVTKHTVSWTVPDHVTIAPSSPQEVEDGSSITFTITPDSGYNLTSASFADVQATISDNVGTLVYTPNADYSGTFTVQLTEQSTTFNYRLTKSGGNFSISPEGGIYEGLSGDTLTVTVTPNSGYEFVENSQIGWLITKGTSAGGDLLDSGSSDSITTDRTGAHSVSITLPSEACRIEISASMRQLQTSRIFNYTYSGEHITISPVSPVTFDETEIGTIIFTPEDGWLIESIIADTFDPTTITEIPITISTDKSSATATIPVDLDSCRFVIVTSEKPAPANVSKFYSIYIPNNDDINAIAQAIFLDNGKKADIYDQVIAYQQMFFTVPSDGKKDMTFGKYDFNRQVDYTDKTTMTIDMGSVQLTEHFKNANDYTGTNIQFYIPLYGYVELDPVQVMGKEINLRYECELIQGKALAIVSTTFGADTVDIAQYACNMREIEPIGTTYDNHSTGVYLEIMTNQLGKLQPFLLIGRVIPMDDVINTQGITRNERVRVGDVNGYVQYLTIPVEGIAATGQELSQIESLLKSGVWHGTIS